VFDVTVRQPGELPCGIVTVPSTVSPVVSSILTEASLADFRYARPIVCVTLSPAPSVVVSCAMKAASELSPESRM
jgi:hypothetical protein